MDQYQIVIEKENKLKAFINDKVALCKNDDPVVIFGSDEGQESIQDLAQALLDVNFLDEKFAYIYDYHVENYENNLNKIGLKMAIGCYKSKLSLINAGSNIKIGIIIPVFSEGDRIKPYSFSNPLGENALNIKIMQFMWLASTNKNIKLIFIGDNDNSGSIEEISLLLNRKISSSFLIQVTTLKKLYQKHLSAIHIEADLSVKGGSVILGLYDLWKDGYTYGIYSDFDITCPISHAGLLVNELINDKSLAIASYSRRLNSSYGYYWSGKQNMISSLFQEINNELLGENLFDINVGFKCIDLDKIGRDLKNMTCIDLAFDSELIILAKINGFKIKEIPGCFLHKYIEGKQGVSRDYNTMLQTTACLIEKYSLKTHESQKLYKCMNMLGGFYNLVSLLELIKKDNESNEEAIKRFSELMEA